MSTKSFQLNNGVVMPAVGLGTFRVRGRDLIYSIIDSALQAGYRLFDTAAVYQNEEDIGFALKELLPKYGLSRNDVFITTKLSPSSHGDAKTLTAVFESLKKLQTNYIDLYLIHWPGASGVAVGDQLNAKLRSQSWQSLVEAYHKGLVKAIGVSNYTVRHLTELISTSHEVIPAVNQVEWHPYYYQPELYDFCQQNKIVLQAYSSLGTSDKTSLIDDPVVVTIASKLNVSPAQLLLCWALQHDVAVIPKARSSDHIKDNIKLDFIIPKEHMIELDKLGARSEKYAWNPNDVE